MAEKQKPPVVVAELGRPETPQETAARKAENSRLYRQRKTINNLALSLLVCLGVTVLIVLVVPRGVDTWSDYRVDVAKSAAESSAAIDMPLVAPATPETWKAKQAQLRTTSDADTVSWHITYTTENEAFAEVVQAFTRSGDSISDAWIGERLDGRAATGTETIGGLEWTVYDHPEVSPETSNVVFGLETHIGATTLLVFGTDRPEVIRTLAASVADDANSMLMADTEAHS